MMTCSGRDVYENHLGSTDQGGNWANSPWSCQPSNHALNCSRLTYANALNSFDPCPECIDSVNSRLSASDPIRLTYSGDSFDGQYDKYSTCLSTDVLSAATGTAVSNGDTVDTTTPETPPATNAELEELVDKAEAFSVRGGRKSLGSSLGKLAPRTNGVYVASSKRSNAREGIVEMPGFKDSNIFSREAFLDTRAEQEKSNALSLAAIAACCIVFTVLIIACFWKNGCGCCQPPVVGGGYKPYSLNGGAKSAIKSSPSTKLSGGHIF